MKRMFSLFKKKASSSESPEDRQLSAGYELKKKDLNQLHKAAFDGDWVKVMELTTKKRKDINQLDKQHRTPLHIASALGHESVVNFIAENAGQLDVLDAQNRTALMKAVQGQHDKCVCLLLNNGADANLVDVNKNTALHLAAKMSSVSIAELLLESNADISAANQHGLTPLALAVCEDHIEMVEYLLRNGADVDVADNMNKSPLMIAAENSQSAMIQLLLRYDADISLKDNRGLSAKDYAAMNEDRSCFELINDHETQISNEVSSLHQDQSNEEQLSPASQSSEVGGSEDGAATDEDENEASRWEEDFKEDFEPESSNVVSKSGNDGQRKEESGMRQEFTLEDLDWDSETEDQLLDSDEEETSLVQQEPSPASVPTQTNSPSTSRALSRFPERSSTDCSDSDDYEPPKWPKMTKRLSLSQRNLNSNIFRRVSSQADLSLIVKETETEPAPKNRLSRSRSTAKVEMVENPSSETEDQLLDSDEEETSLVQKEPSPVSVPTQKNSPSTSRALSRFPERSSTDCSDSDDYEPPKRPKMLKQLSLSQRNLNSNIFRRVSSQADLSLIDKETETEPAPKIRLSRSRSTAKVEMVEHPSSSAHCDETDSGALEEVSDCDSDSITKQEPSPDFASPIDKTNTKSKSPSLSWGSYDSSMTWSDCENIDDFPTTQQISARMRKAFEQFDSFQSGQESEPEPEPAPQISSSLTPPRTSPLQATVANEMVCELSMPAAEVETVENQTINVDQDEEKNAHYDEEKSDRDESLKKTEETIYKPSLYKPGSRSNPNRDFMEELGLTADILADVSDCESDTGDHTLPDTERFSETFPVDKRMSPASVSPSPYFPSWSGAVSRHAGRYYDRSSSDVDDDPPKTEQITNSSTQDDSPLSDPEPDPAPTQSTVNVDMEEYQSSNAHCDGEKSDQDESLQEIEETTYKPESHFNQNTDLMEELGQTDADALEDASDCDSALQIGSSLTLPRIRSPQMASTLLSSSQEQEVSTDDDWDLHDMSEQEEEYEEEQQESEQDFNGESEQNFENPSDCDLDSTTKDHTLPEVQQEPSPDFASPINKSQSPASVTSQQTINTPSQSASLCWRSYHNSMTDADNNEDSLTLEKKLKSFLQSQRNISSSKIRKGSQQVDNFLSEQAPEPESALQVGSSLTLPRIRSPQMASTLLSSSQEQEVSTDDDWDLHDMSEQEEEYEEEQQEREQDLDGESEQNFENPSDCDSDSITRGHTLSQVQQEPSPWIEFPETDTVPQICTSQTLPRVSLAQMTTHLSSFEKPEGSHDDNSDLYDYMSGQEEEHEEEQQEREEDIDAAFWGSEDETSNDNEDDSMAELGLEKEEVLNVMDYDSASEDIDFLLTESENEMVNEKELLTVELETSTLVDDMKQLEEEHSTSTAEEDLLNSYVHEQLELDTENTDSNVQEQTLTLLEQIRFMRRDVECAVDNSNLKEMNNLLEENEALKDQLLEAQREIKATKDSRMEAMLDCKSLKTDLESALAHLATARQEAEQSSAAKADAEKALLKEREENQRLKDRLNADSAVHREAVSSLSQKLSTAESDINSLKNELDRFMLQLTEKDVLLNVVQNEKQQLAGQVKKLDKTLQAQNKLLSKTRARYEAMQEKVSLTEEKNRELTCKTVDLQNQVFSLEEEKSQGEVGVTQLQQELNDALNKLSKSEASLEEMTHRHSDLEEENLQVRKHRDRLKEKLAQTVDENVQAEQHLNTLKSSFIEKKKELAVTTKRLQEALSAQSSAGTVKKLEETVQRLELKNARFEEDLQTQLKRETSLLEKEARKGQRKVNELTEQKNIADARLDQEMKRNAELNNDKSRMKTLIKKAKTKLQEQRQEMEQKDRELLEVRQQLELAQRQQSQDSHQLQHKLEQRNRELETEVSRSNASLLDSLTQQKSIAMELEKYKSLYSEEQRQRKKLTAKLENTNARLTETYSQLVCERLKFERHCDSTLNGGILGSLGLNQSQRLSQFNTYSSGSSNRVE